MCCAKLPCRVAGPSCRGQFPFHLLPVSPVLIAGRSSIVALAASQLPEHPGRSSAVTSTAIMHGTGTLSAGSHILSSLELRGFVPPIRSCVQNSSGKPSEQSLRFRLPPSGTTFLDELTPSAEYGRDSLCRAGMDRIWVRNPYVVEVHPVGSPPCDYALNVSRAGAYSTRRAGQAYHLRPRAGREPLPNRTFDPGEWVVSMYVTPDYVPTRTGSSEARTIRAATRVCR